MCNTLTYATAHVPTALDPAICLLSRPSRGCAPATCMCCNFSCLTAEGACALLALRMLAELSAEQQGCDCQCTPAFMPSSACMRLALLQLQSCPALMALMDDDACRGAGEGPPYYLACPHLSLITTRASTSRLALRCVQEVLSCECPCCTKPAGSAQAATGPSLLCTW